MNNSQQQYNYQMEYAAFTPNISTRTNSSFYSRAAVPTPTTSYRAPLAPSAQSVHRRPLPTQYSSTGSGHADWISSSSSSSLPPPPPAPRRTRPSSMIPYQAFEEEEEEESGILLRRRANSLSTSRGASSQQLSFLPRRWQERDGSRRVQKQQQQQQQQSSDYNSQLPSQSQVPLPQAQAQMQSHSQSQPRLLQHRHFQRSRSFREQKAVRFDDEHDRKVPALALPPSSPSQQRQEQQEEQEYSAWQIQTRPLQQPQRRSMNLSPEALAQNPHLVYFPPHHQQQLQEQQQEQPRKSPRNSLDDAEDLLKRSMSRIQALGFSARSRAKTSNSRSSRRENKGRV